MCYFAPTSICYSTIEKQAFWRAENYAIAYFFGIIFLALTFVALVLYPRTSRIGLGIQVLLTLILRVNRRYAPHEYVWESYVQSLKGWIDHPGENICYYFSDNLCISTQQDEFALYAQTTTMINLLDILLALTLAIATYVRRESIRSTSRTLFAHLFIWRLEEYNGALHFAMAGFSTRPPPLQRAHSHSQAARMRSAATHWMSAFATTVGHDPVHVGARKRVDVGTAYTLSLLDQHGLDKYGDWDINAPSERTPMFIFTDTINHTDLPSFIRTHPIAPLIAYTATPAAAACSEGMDKFCFDPEGRLVTFVNGGIRIAEYLWDFNHDTVRVLLTDYLIGAHFIEYRVTQLARGNHRSIVLLEPKRRFLSLFGAYKVLNIFSACLDRFNPIVETTRVTGDLARPARELFVRFTILPRVENDPILVTTGRPDSFDSALTTASQDAQLRTMAEVTVNRLTPAAVKGIGVSDAEAYVVTLFHRCTALRDPPVKYSPIVPIRDENNQPLDSAVHGFDFINDVDGYDPDAKPCLTAIAPPIADGCYAPVASKANERRSIASRVTAPQSKQGKSIMPKVIAYGREFVDLLFPHKKRLRLADIDDVYEKQCRPTQVQILDEATHDLSIKDKIAKCFVKAEAYSYANDPRNISTILPADKLSHSRVCYALSSYLKEHADDPIGCWYAFGRSPRDIAHSVSLVCQLSQHEVAATDFSRFDGHFNATLRCVEDMIYLDAFDPLDVDYALNSAKRNRDMPGLTRRGVRFETGMSRLSGSPETSIMNTLMNKFINYVAFRIAGESPRPAFLRPGIYGGDDGLTADLDPTHAIAAADLCGHVLELDRYPKGSTGVTFLSRFFGPGVWGGDINSCADIARQMVKIHTTPHLGDFSPHEKLTIKCYSLYINDPATPVLGEYCRAVLLGAGLLNPDGDELVIDPTNPLVEYSKTDRWTPYWYRYSLEFKDTEEARFPNTLDDWMYDLVNLQMPGFDMEAFSNWLARVPIGQPEAFTAWLLDTPLCWTATPKEPKSAVVLDADLVVPKGNSPTIEEVIPDDMPALSPIDPDYTYTVVNDELVRSSTKPTGAKPKAEKTVNPKHKPDSPNDQNRGKTGRQPRRQAQRSKAKATGKKGPGKPAPKRQATPQKQTAPTGAPPSEVGVG
jgi:hypothetical protein